MRIVEFHVNGAQLQVSGIFGVKRFVEYWRHVQNSIEPPEHPSEDHPQGAYAQAERAPERFYESETLGSEVPVITGFVRNEVRRAA